MPVTVLRHCKSLYNSASAEQREAANRAGESHSLRDADLSLEGEEQLTLLMKYAWKLFPDVRVVFTSPYRRALRTAIPLAAALGARLYVAPALREVRHDVGDIGTPGAELDKEFPKLGLEKLPERWWQEKCSCPEMKECGKCVEARVADFRALARENDGAIFVSHSDIMIAACGIDVWGGQYATYTAPAKTD